MNLTEKYNSHVNLSALLTKRANVRLTIANSERHFDDMEKKRFLVTEIYEVIGFSPHALKVCKMKFKLYITNLHKSHQVDAHKRSDSVKWHL